MRANKYGAVPTVVDGKKFDSKMEADRYRHLCLMLRAGIISNLEIHPKFTLVNPFVKKGKKKSGISYTADFMYQNEQGETVVEDVKGTIARDFSLRKTLFDLKYPDIDLMVVKHERGMWVEK